MKLIFVLSMILASNIVESTYEFGLFQQMVAIPANGKKTVKYQITYPLHVS